MHKHAPCAIAILVSGKTAFGKNRNIEPIFLELVQHYLTEKDKSGSVDQSRKRWAVCFNDKILTDEDEKNGIITNRWIHGHTEENSFFTEGLLELVCVILSMFFGTSITFF